MQEQMNSQMMALVWRGSRLTAQTLTRLILAAVNNAITPRGEMSVKNLIRQGQGAESLPITQDGEAALSVFRGIAKKYGVDFALERSTATQPPTWTLFFKGKDRDVIDHAFKEFVAQMSVRARTNSEIEPQARQAEQTAEVEILPPPNRPLTLEGRPEPIALAPAGETPELSGRPVRESLNGRQAMFALPSPGASDNDRPSVLAALREAQKLVAARSAPSEKHRELAAR